MTAKLIFKTEAPAALHWMHDIDAADKAKRAAWDAFQTEVTAELGPVPGEERRTLISARGRIVGVTRSAAEYAQRNAYTTRFPGWREHPRFDALTPKLNSKVGKAWQERIDALPHLFARDELTRVGMPSMAMAMAGMHMYEPGIDVDRDETGAPTALYVLWGSEGCRDEVIAAAGHTDAGWTEMKLSQWHARLEAKEAAA